MLRLFVLTCLVTETNELSQKKFVFSQSSKTKSLLKIKITNQHPLIEQILWVVKKSIYIEGKKYVSK